MLSHQLMLAAIDTTTILVGVVGLAAGAALYFLLARTIKIQSIAAAKSEAARLIEHANAEAKTTRAQAEVDAEKLIGERKQKAESENEVIRRELKEAEKRLEKREEFFDKKIETLTQKEELLGKTTEQLKAREQELAKKDAEVVNTIRQQKDKLLQVAQMTVEEARTELLLRVEGDSRLEMAKITARQIAEAESEAKKKAQEITLMAIQRYAAEHTAESTVRAVPIPSGRHEGADHRARGAEHPCDREGDRGGHHRGRHAGGDRGVVLRQGAPGDRGGVAPAADRGRADAPEPYRGGGGEGEGGDREKIIKCGKDAVLEVNLRGIHPKVSEAMGKLHFRTSYGQNVLRHSVEVAMLSQIIADQLGLDGTIARRCGFLHDIGKAMDEEMEGGHPKIGMDFARQYGEKDPVLNAIGGHHADIPSTSFYTPIVMAADAVSSARPGARRESMEKYIQRLNELQDIAMQQPGVTEAYAIQAGREVRVMVDARKISDDEAQTVAFNIAKKVSEEMTFPGEIRVTVLRETRAVEFAR